MRFITLAPILCLLAVVAAYPIQYVRSLERPTEHLIQRSFITKAVTDLEDLKDLVDPKEEQNLISQLTGPSSSVLTWSYYFNHVQSLGTGLDPKTTKALDQAKQQALDRAAKYILELQNKKSFPLQSVLIELYGKSVNGWDHSLDYVDWTANVIVNGSGPKTFCWNMITNRSC